jgi:hypothetical protein
MESKRQSAVIVDYSFEKTPFDYNFEKTSLYTTFLVSFV